MGWSYSEVENGFLDFLHDVGAAPAPGVKITADGRNHRFELACDHDKRKQRGRSKEENAIYRLYYDDYPAGWVRVYKASMGDLFVKWAMGRDGRELTDEEKRKAIAEAAWRANAKKEREKQAEIATAKAVQSARDRWKAATPLTAKHPYIAKKKLHAAHGARLLGQELILPLVNEFDEIMSIQRIFPDGQKRFQTGAPIRGCYIVLPAFSPPKIPKRDAVSPAAPKGGVAKPPQGGMGDPGSETTKPNDANGSNQGSKGAGSLGGAGGGAPRIWLCEGWATGASICEAVHEQVICALNAGGIPVVAQILRRKYPDREIVVAPDWDRSAGNAGMAVAFQVMDELGLAAVPPPFEEGESGTDWNDFCVSHGLKETRKALLDGLRRNYEAPGFRMRRRDKLFPDRKADGTPKKTEANMSSLLAYLGASVRYNIITKKIEYRIAAKTFSVDNVQNAADAHLASKCVEYGLNEAAWRSFAWAIVDRAAYNPVKDWIQSKAWDGRTRLLNLVDTVCTPPSFPGDMKEILIVRWLLSAVAAVMEDGGFRTRGVLVFQGKQSSGKTSWFRNLIPDRYHKEWFGEGVALNIDNKDSVKMAISKWVTELGELEGTFKRSDLSKLKAFITLDGDEMRLPYAAGEATFPRRTVFAATVNDKHFLQDETGNTRWWCIETVHIDYQHGIDTQQVFAEIYETMYLKKEKWWLPPETEARLEELNQEHRVLSAAEDLIGRKLEWTAIKSDWTYRTVTEALIECGMERPQRSDIQKASQVIQSITGQTRAIRVGHGGSRVYLLPPYQKVGPIVKESDLSGDG